MVSVLLYANSPLTLVIITSDVQWVRCITANVEVHWTVGGGVQHTVAPREWTGRAAALTRWNVSEKHPFSWWKKWWLLTLKHACKLSTIFHKSRWNKPVGMHLVSYQFMNKWLNPYAIRIRDSEIFCVNKMTLHCKNADQGKQEWLVCFDIYTIGHIV